MKLGSPKGRKGQKNNHWISDQNFSKCDENFKPRDLKIPNNPKDKNTKKATTKHSIIKLFKISDEVKKS